MPCQKLDYELSDESQFSLEMNGSGKSATTVKEILELIEVSFQYVTETDGIGLFTERESSSQRMYARRLLVYLPAIFRY